MRKSFEEIIQQVNEFTFVMEEALKLLKNSPQNFKIKKKVETAFKGVQLALERHENLITDSVPPMIVDTSKYAKEFADTWKIYKDYMMEQFGIRMSSRMQVFRLTLLSEYANDDFQMATRWLEYYMANGAKNIYPVNELKPEDKNDSTESKAGFVLPKQ